MADGEVRIDTKLDTSGLDKGLKDMKGKLGDAGKTLDEGTKKHKGFAESLKGIKAGAAVAAVGVAGVTAAVKKTVEVMNECAEAYNIQKNAETALQIAAKNNPYLTGESVYNLRNFASELQNVSEIGDEYSLQIMAQLAATGRDEEQIMQIMSAAADMAAATGQDVRSVAQTLSATLNGVAGELGRNNSEIKKLSTEELKNGKAVEIVAAQYKGLAKETANAGVQLKNAIGDYKEELGAYFAKATEPVKSFFAELIGGWASAKKARREYEEAAEAVENGTADIGQMETALAKEKEMLEALSKARAQASLLLEHDDKFIRNSVQYGEFTTWSDSSNPLQDFKARQEEIIANYDRQNAKVAELTRQLNQQKDEETQAAAAAKEKADAEERAAAALERARARDSEAVSIINSNRAAREGEIEALELRKKLLNENYSDQEIYNIYLKSYIDLITRSGGLISENNTAAKNLMKLIEEWAPKAQAAAEAEERLNAALELREQLKDIAPEDNAGVIDSYKKELEEIEKLRAEIEQTYTDQVKDENGELIFNEEEKNAALLALDEKYAQAKKDVWADMTAEINGYLKQTTQIAQEASALMLESVQTETELELAKLQEKYEKGEVEESAYYEKQKEIQKKAAREEYKIKMFEWTASVLTATANIAEGVSKAIAQGGTAGLISGALVGAAGAVQIASIMASKPIPPQFAGGGIIGGANGASMGGDNTYIHARAGEMVLNANQQRSLWDMINGQGSRQQAGLNLTVNNTQANKVDAAVRQQNGELYIDILDKHINKGFTDGTYDAGYAAMNTRQEGVRIL